MTFFFLIVLSVFGLIYGYTGWRLLAPLPVGRGWKLSAGAALALFLGLLFGLRFSRFGLSSTVYGVAVWTTYTVFAFVLLTWIILISRDTCWLIAVMLRRYGHRVRRFLARQRPAAVSALNPERRLFLLNAANLGTVGLSTGLVGLGVRSARIDIRVEPVSLSLPGLPACMEGLRILQISDLHVGLTIDRSFVQRIVDQAGSQQADLIALTGDIVDGEIAALRREVAPLAELRAPLGCYFVTGNHEYYNSSPLGWLQEFRAMGYTVLLNEHRVIRRDNGRLVLAGVTDHDAGLLMPGHGSSPEKAFRGAPDDTTRILLAHQPRSIHAAARVKTHLQLSGHTHGGQFIPWNYAVRLQQPYLAGLHQQNKTWIYVNRGAGYWGPPMRLGAPGEITLLTLRRAATEPSIA